MTLFCRLVLMLLLAASPARAELSGMRVDRSCLVTVWAPDDAKLAESDRWNDDNDRLSLVSDAPGGGGPALEMFSAADTPSGRAGYKNRIPDAKRTRADFARIQAEFYIPPGTRFDVGGAKMPLGIYGGDPASEKMCATGGCPPERQTGFSVRLTRHPVDKIRPGEHGPRIYSYHLNRQSPRKAFEDTHSRRKGFDELQFGEVSNMRVAFPLGEWFTLTMDVAVNHASDTRIVPDGFSDLYMHDSSGRLMGRVSAEGLLFRRDPSWHIFGPLLADRWGGDQTSPRHMPVMDTRMYSRHYRLSILDEDRSLAACLDPDRRPLGW